MHRIIFFLQIYYFVPFILRQTWKLSHNSNIFHKRTSNFFQYTIFHKHTTAFNALYHVLPSSPFNPFSLLLSDWLKKRSTSLVENTLTHSYNDLVFSCQDFFKVSIICFRQNLKTNLKSAWKNTLKSIIIFKIVW